MKPSKLLPTTRRIRNLSSISAKKKALRKLFCKTARNRSNLMMRAATKLLLKTVIKARSQSRSARAAMPSLSTQKKVAEITSMSRAARATIRSLWEITRLLPSTWKTAAKIKLFSPPTPPNKTSRLKIIKHLSAAAFKLRLMILRNSSRRFRLKIFLLATAKSKSAAQKSFSQEIQTQKAVQSLICSQTKKNRRSVSRTKTAAHSM